MADHVDWITCARVVIVLSLVAWAGVALVAWAGSVITNTLALQAGF